MSASESSNEARPALPTGVVTFLLTDVESSTSMWQAEPEAMAAAIGRHYRILDAAIDLHGGSRPEEQGEGDSVVGAFNRASDALAAARDAQIALGSERWPTARPLTVRMGIHTGQAQHRGEHNYVGLAIVRAARVRNLAAGGQVLVTSAVADLADGMLPESVRLVDLGEHHLKDLTSIERLYQLAHPGLRVEFPPLVSVDPTSSSLPVNLSSFVGRDNELTTLGDLLTEGRLVTVVGAGGAGKTRLTLQFASTAGETFDEGIWWIDLAAVTEPDQTATALAAVVGAESSDSRRHTEAVAARISARRALIVLDNCEHLNTEPSRVAMLLLSMCPNLRVLATSRRPLDVPGEVTWRIPAMNTPSADTTLMDVERIAVLDSVQLFVHRAKQAHPQFELDAENAADVGEICRRLGGIPLAIELAAARTKSMLANQILSGLDDALRVLGHGPRMLSARHRTIEACIRWSSELLTNPERLLLERLSVFHGSFDLAGAEAVCSDERLDQPGILDAMDGLIDQSLARPLDHGTSRRFVMLETVRQFGAANLQSDGTRRHWQQRAATYFAEVAASTGPRCETADQFVALEVLDAEHKNLQATLKWLHAQKMSEEFTKMVVDLGGYWDVGGDKLEGETWATRALDAAPAGELAGRSRLLALRAECRHSIGNYMGALKDGHRALDLGREVGDAVGAGRGSSTISSILSHVDLDAWQDQWNTTVELLEEADDQYTLAGTHTWGAVPFLRRGRLQEGLAALDEARPHVLATGSPLLIASQQCWEAYALVMVGEGARAEALALAARDSGALRSHARAKGVRTILDRARATLGGESLSWRELVSDLERSRRRGEHFAVDHDVIVTALAALKSNPFAAIEMVDQWLTERDGLETTQHPEARLIGTHAALALGDLDDARHRAHLTLESAERVQHVLVIARTKATLAAIDLESGETVAAEALVREAIATHVEHGNRPALSECFGVLASIAASCRDFEEAGHIFGALAGRGRNPGFKRILAEATQALTDNLDSDDLAIITEAGAELTHGELLAFVDRSRGRRGRPALGWDSLSPTERAVALLVRDGLTNRQVAVRLLMGAETVKTHMSHIFRKLDITRRAQLAAIVVEREATS